MRRSSSMGGVWAVAPAIALIAFIGLSPFISAGWNSFFSGLWENRSFVGFDNYRAILDDRAFSYSLNITIAWAILSAALSTFAGLFLALAMAGPGRSAKFRTWLLILPWGIPVYIAVPLWRAFLHGSGGLSLFARITGLSLNLLNDPVAAFGSTLVVDVWMQVALVAFAFTAQMRQIPLQVFEAARMDGANEKQIARFILAPALRTSFIALGLRNLIVAFKEFSLVYLMTAGGPPLISGITEHYIVGATTTLGIFLYDLFHASGEWGLVSAYSMLISAGVFISVVLWFFIRRNNRSRRREVFLMLLSALAQLPGAVPFLWLFALGYVLSIRFSRIRTLVLCTHIMFLLWCILDQGFLPGFHPGIVISIITVTSSRMRLRKPRSLTFPRFSANLLGAASSFSWLFVVVSTLVIVFMLIWMSLSNVSAVYVDRLVPPGAGWQNFVTALGDENILRYFTNTAFIAAATAIFVPLVIFPAAVWLSNQGKTWIIYALAAVQMLEMSGGMHSLIPLYRLFIAMGLSESYVPIILIYAYHAIPFSLLLLCSYLISIPRSLRDMALIEGMRLASYSYRILLPLSLPAIGTAMMAAFISAWNGFLPALLFLNTESRYPISLKLHEWVGSIASGTPHWNLFAAGSVLNMLIIGGLLYRFRNPLDTSELSGIGE